MVAHTARHQKNLVGGTAIFIYRLASTTILQKNIPSNCGTVAKMASHAIFQYNVLVIDIDNTTLGLI